jgi:pyruvate kinase
MNRTKIVCTIGPASRDPELLGRLMQAGMNVARLNFSHGTLEEHAAVIADLRRVAEELGKPVAILQDIAGPKIRTGPIAEGEVVLIEGAKIILTTRDVPGDADLVGLTYKELPRSVRAGDHLMLADGLLELAVEQVAADDIHCTVVSGGPLTSHKGINLPGRSINAPILTEKDERDLAFGLEQSVDYVALSFVRTAHDIQTVRNLVEKHGSRVALIAKIEKHEALDNIDEIVPLIDGLMVARGDLGVEIPIEQVPRAQKMLIEKANEAAIPVITAIMLSEETAIGKHPVAAVEVMTKVAADMEEMFPYDEWTRKYEECAKLSFEEAVAHAACAMADDIGAAAIITCTQSGSTTLNVAKYRPKQMLLAMTPDTETRRRLALVWGAISEVITSEDNALLIERNAITAALQAGHIRHTSCFGRCRLAGDVRWTGRDRSNRRDLIPSKTSARRAQDSEGTRTPPDQCTAEPFRRCHEAPGHWSGPGHRPVIGQPQPGDGADPES